MWVASGQNARTVCGGGAYRLAPDEPVRDGSLKSMTDQGCICAYSRDIVHRVHPHGEHLHSGAGLHLRRQSDRGHGGPQSAPLASQVFAVSADPAELRFDDRIFAGPAADVSLAGVALSLAAVLRGVRPFAG